MQFLTRISLSEKLMNGFWNLLLNISAKVVYGGIHETEDLSSDEPRSRKIVLENVKELRIQIVRYLGGLCGSQWYTPQHCRDCRRQLFEYFIYVLEQFQLLARDNVSRYILNPVLLSIIISDCCREWTPNFSTVLSVAAVPFACSMWFSFTFRIMCSVTFWRSI